MEETLKSGTSIKGPRPSRPRPRMNQWISELLVDQETCKFGQPTQDGGNSSLMKEASSQMLRTTESLMFTKERILNTKQLLCGRDTVRLTRNGRSSILTKLSKLKLRDLTKSSVSISTDHSTSDQDSQCTESLNALELATLFSRDIDHKVTSIHNDSSSIALPRPSDHNTGRTMLWKSNLMEDQATSE
jgi:hypothetical protein